MICLEKMLNFDDFTSSKFFYFLIVKKHQFYRFFLKKCLNLGFLYIRNGNSTTTFLLQNIKKMDGALCCHQKFSKKSLIVPKKLKTPK